MSSNYQLRTRGDRVRDWFKQTALDARCKLIGHGPIHREPEGHGSMWDLQYCKRCGATVARVPSDPPR